MKSLFVIIKFRLQNLLNFTKSKSLYFVKLVGGSGDLRHFRRKELLTEVAVALVHLIESALLGHQRGLSVLLHHGVQKRGIPV